MAAPCVLEEANLSVLASQGFPGHDFVAFVQLFADRWGWFPSGLVSALAWILRAFDVGAAMFGYLSRTVARFFSFFEYQTEGRSQGHLALPEVVDLYNGDGVLLACIGEMNRTSGTLTIDCSGLVYMDSAGAAVILDMFKRVFRSRRELILTNLREQPRSIFEMYGFGSLLERCSTPHMEDTYIVLDGELGVEPENQLSLVPAAAASESVQPPLRRVA